MARIALVTALVAVLAVNVATLGRNTSAALVAMAAWALAVERSVSALRPGLARFMIGENVATVVPWTPLTDVGFERPPVDRAGVARCVRGRGGRHRHGVVRQERRRRNVSGARVSAAHDRR